MQKAENLDYVSSFLYPQNLSIKVEKRFNMIRPNSQRFLQASGFTINQIMTADLYPYRFRIADNQFFKQLFEPLKTSFTPFKKILHFPILLRHQCPVHFLMSNIRG